MGIRKTSPATVLMKMVATMALGTWTEGFWTSSHMLHGVLAIQDSTVIRGVNSDETYEMIIPVEEVA